MMWRVQTVAGDNVGCVCVSDNICGMLSFTTDKHSDSSLGTYIFIICESSVSIKVNI